MQQAAIVVAIMAAILGTSAEPARASGLHVPAVGHGASGPLSADPAALYWNPAMLSALDRPQILVGGHLLAGRLQYTRERRAVYQREDAFRFALPIPADALDPERSGTAEPVTARPVGVAPSVFAAQPIGTSRWTAALGAHAPHAALVSFPADGPQRFAVQDATIAAVHLTSAAAVHVSDRLQVGAGATLVLGYASLSRVQDFAALDDLGQALARPPISQPNDFGPDAPPAVRELEVLARPIRVSNATGAAPTFNAGAVLRPTDDWRLAVSWQHGVRLRLAGRFSLDMDDPFFTGDLASQGLRYAPRVDGDARLSLRLPGTLLTGVAWEPGDRWTFALWGAWARWSTFDAIEVQVRSPELAQPELGLPDTSVLRIAREWRDTVGVESVVGHHRGPWSVLARTGLRSGASPDTTVDVSSPDGDRVIAGIGASRVLSRRVTIHGDLLVHHVLRREVVASRHDLGNGTYRFTLASAGLFLALHPGPLADPDGSPSAAVAGRR